MTLDILRMDVTKELLRKMEKEERALFLALGHASNQVNALWKLVIILTNGDTDDPVKQRLESDLLVIEATFLQRDAAMAADYGHLTAAKAAELAADAGVK